MRKLSLIGLLSAAFMFPQIPLSVDYSLDFLNVLTLLNHPVSKHMFINTTSIRNGILYLQLPYTFSYISSLLSEMNSSFTRSSPGRSQFIE